MSYQEHVLDENLEAYVMRQLQEEETEVIEDHLLLCPQCQQRLSETEQRIKAARTAARRIRDGEERARMQQGLLGRLFAARFSRPVWGLAVAMAMAAILIVPRLQQQGPYQDVSLTVMRGGETTFDAEHGRLLRLHLDARELVVPAGAQVTIVSAGGEPVWSSSRIDRPDPNSLAVSLDRPLGAGQHWVRVVRPPDQIVREYSLRLR